MNAYRLRLLRLHALYPKGARVRLEGHREATVTGVEALPSGTLAIRVRVPSYNLDGFTDLHRLPCELTPPELPEEVSA